MLKTYCFKIFQFIQSANMIKMGVIDETPVLLKFIILINGTKHATFVTTRNFVNTTTPL